MMPRLGGYAVLEHLQTLAEPPPVIMITAKEGEQHKVYAEYLGVVDYLNKPFPSSAFWRVSRKGWQVKANARSSSTRIATSVTLQ